MWGLNSWPWDEELHIKYLLIDCWLVIFEFQNRISLVENSKDNEDSILQREIPARQSRRRFRKINYKGERQTITDDVDINSYLSVSIFRKSSWIVLNFYI